MVIKPSLVIQYSQIEPYFIFYTVQYFILQYSCWDFTPFSNKYFLSICCEQYNWSIMPSKISLSKLVRWHTVHKLPSQQQYCGSWPSIIPNPEDLTLVFWLPQVPHTYTSDAHKYMESNIHTHKNVYQCNLKSTSARMLLSERSFMVPSGRGYGRRDYPVRCWVLCGALFRSSKKKIKKEIWM